MGGHPGAEFIRQSGRTCSILYTESLFFQRKLNNFLRPSAIHDYWKSNGNTFFFMHFLVWNATNFITCNDIFKKLKSRAKKNFDVGYNI